MYVLRFFLVFTFFFFNDPATTEIYTYGHTLSLHDALPIFVRIDRHLDEAAAPQRLEGGGQGRAVHGEQRRDRSRARRLGTVQRHHQRELSIGEAERAQRLVKAPRQRRSEEHTSELQSLMRISYAGFCLKNKNTKENT